MKPILRHVLRPCSTSIAAPALVLALAGAANAFDFNVENSCVLLNNNNTDVFGRPADCDLPENQSWCNCTRTVLTNPIRGQSSALEQASSG